MEAFLKSSKEMKKGWIDIEHIIIPMIQELSMKYPMIVQVERGIRQ